MTLFTAAQEFCLDQHLDETKQPDVRLRLHELFKRTKETVARERQISLEVVLLIGLLETQNAAVNLGLGKRENLARSFVNRQLKCATLVGMRQLNCASRRPYQ